MILADRDIRHAKNIGALRVDPWDERQLQPASYDVRLGPELAVRRPGTVIDPAVDQASFYERVPVQDAAGPAHLAPRQFVLGSTLERFEIPENCVGRIEGKSSLGRLGLIVHATAGYIDPGFRGHITLELANVEAEPIILRHGMLIGQLALTVMRTHAERPYGHANGSRYQDQGPRPAISRAHLSYQRGEPVW